MILLSQTNLCKIVKWWVIAFHVFSSNPNNVFTVYTSEVDKTSASQVLKLMYIQPQCADLFELGTIIVSIVSVNATYTYSSDKDVFIELFEHQAKRVMAFVLVL